MNTVERIKNICKERKIPISKLEKECGFANGYIGQLKKGTVPDDRLFKIASFLNVNANYLATGDENTGNQTDKNSISIIQMMFEDDAIDYVKLYSLLDFSDRKLVKNLTLTLLEQDKYKEKSISSEKMA